MIRLELSIALEYQVMQATEFVFKVCAAETPQQKVVVKNLDVPPGMQYTLERCRHFHNQHLRLHANPGQLKIQYAARVDINHTLVAPENLTEVPVTSMPVDILYYLQPSRYCPSDRFYQIALQEFGAMPPGYARVRAIRDWVHHRTRYQPGTTNSFQCAVDTLNSKMGVSKDYAHLMISLCRALNIPARFVNSVAYGADAALGSTDFHAYVEAYLSGRWYTFDPTGLCPVTGLVRLATGRDANDVAFATVFGSVMWSIPRVSAVALTGPGISLPAHTDLAVSSAGVSGRRITPISTTRLDSMMLKPPAPAFSSILAPQYRSTH